MTSKILIVEDDPLVAIMIEGFLDALGYELAGCEGSLGGALARLASSDFDAVILDVHLANGETSEAVGKALREADIPFVVATGDGELLMNVSTLATVGALQPPNLSILCVDNGHYGETGYQKSHTSLGVDLERMAIGAGIGSTMTIEREDQLAAGVRMLRESNGTSFVLVKVSTVDAPKDKLSLDGGANRVRFRQALLRAARCAGA